MGQWIRFFLVAVRETAWTGTSTFEDTSHLREKVEQRVLSLGQRAGDGRKLLTLLDRQPSVHVQDAADHLEVSHPTASSLVSDSEDLGILDETTGQQRNRRYFFRDYVDLFT